jgi:hypothetical protein
MSRGAKRLAVVAAALAAFALVPAAAATAHAGEASVSGQERAAGGWMYIHTMSDAACHRDGTYFKNKGWIVAYECRWHPPLQFGVSELWGLTP